MARKRLIVISGPTASGKTSLAIEIAEKLNTEIISADSRQLYKKLNIGTAKPTQEELSRVKHHFIDLIGPEERYTAGHYGNEVRSLLTELFRSHNNLILCGGSGLYIDAVIKGIDDSPSADMELRNQLNQRLERKGLESLKAELKRLDPEAFQKIDINNPRRVIRALEVIKTSGKSYEESFENSAKPDFDLAGVILDPDRTELYEKINKRVDKMMASGLLEEVKSLSEHKGKNALNTVGYKELFNYLDGTWGLDTAVDKIKQHTRNYAKRQVTWCKRYHDFLFVDPAEREKIFSFFNI